MAAGFVAGNVGVLVKFDGTPTAMTDEAMSQVTGKFYRVTNAARRCFDPRQDLLVKDNGVNVAAANIASIDYLHGIVEFAGSYTVNGPVTVTGTYLPFSTLGPTSSFSFKVSKAALDKSVFGDLFKRYLLGLGDFSIDLGVFDHLDSSAGVETLEASLAAGTMRVISIEVVQDGSTLANGGIVIRGLVRLANSKVDATPADIVKQGPKLEGTPMVSVNAQVSGTWPVSWSILDGASGLRI